MQKFIVAEVTKNWTKETPVENLLSDKFEEIINVNDQRGYDLKDWKMYQIVNNAVVMRRFGAYEAKGPVLYYNGQKLHTYESDDEAIKAAERWYKRHIKNGA